MERWSEEWWECVTRRIALAGFSVLTLAAIGVI